MFGNTRIQVRLARGIVAIAAAAALLVPAASAAPFITDTLAPGGSASNSHFITDTLAPGGTSVPAAGYRFITDTLAPGGGASGVVSAPAGNGFSWADASIGAVVAAGLMLLAMMGHQLVDRRRRGQLAF